MTSKKKMGRPRIDADSVAHYHLGLRFPDKMRDQLLWLVDIANVEARSRGMTIRITPSMLVRGWIEERMAEEVKRKGPVLNRTTLEFVGKQAGAGQQLGKQAGVVPMTPEEVRQLMARASKKRR